MKKLIFTLLITLGVLNMTAAKNYDAPSKDFVLIKGWTFTMGIPMPIATLLESCDFSGKMIMPFCSHGGGRFGQSLTAIAKLAQHSTLTDGLSIHYSGGSSLSKDVSKWLEKTGVK